MPYDMSLVKVTIGACDVLCEWDEDDWVFALFVSFQGFDSGIYSIIISDKRFINYFNVSGARAGVVASMGMFPAFSRTQAIVYSYL